MNNSNVRIKEEYKPYSKISYDEMGFRIIEFDIPAKYKVHLTEYKLLPGITLYKSNSNLIQRYSNYDHLIDYDNPEDIVLLNYMVNGQGQIGVGKDKFVPITNSDVYIHTIPKYSSPFNFYGKTSMLHILLNKEEIKKHEATYTVEYIELLKKLFTLSQEDNTIILKSEFNTYEILDDIKEYKAYDLISQKVYYQIKIIEIIIHLYELSFKSSGTTYKTYSDAQIRVVRKIKNHLSRDIASYISLEVLSNSYGINLTTLKNCFRDMYGKPLYTWYREYKFHRATELIKNTDYPISRIANMIGYKSSSKFTKAFKKEMGVLPSSYRKNRKKEDK